MACSSEMPECQVPQLFVNASTGSRPSPRSTFAGRNANSTHFMDAGSTLIPWRRARRKRKKTVITAVAAFSGPNPWPDPDPTRPNNVLEGYKTIEQNSRAGRAPEAAKMNLGEFAGELSQTANELTHPPVQLPAKFCIGITSFSGQVEICREGSPPES